MKLLSITLLTSLLVSCGTEYDPLAHLINEERDPEIDYFEIEVDGRDDQQDVYSGDTLSLIWRVENVLFFDVKFYLSEDSQLSNDDFRFIREDCDDISDNCADSVRVEYECDYKSDLRLECDYYGEEFSDKDISSYLDTTPKAGFIIMEACNDGDCDTSRVSVTFN